MSKTATEQLERLTRDAAAEHAKAREAGAELERARADAERAAANLEAGYLSDSEPAIAKACRALATAQDELRTVSTGTPRGCTMPSRQPKQ